MQEFIGRKRELSLLKDLQEKERAAIVTIKGRRRIGKSRLVREFAVGKRFLDFVGIAPIEGVSAQDQRDNFARQFVGHLRIPPLTFNDWSDAFTHLSNSLDDQPTVILLDEISWLGSKDSTFLPKLVAWWETKLQHRSDVILVLCGSQSTWVEENIINGTGFFGRIALMLDLEELSLKECATFIKVLGFKVSDYDIYKLLSVTGGVPWYLESLSPHETVEHNIKRLCFEKGGLLTTEFDRIFHDLFSTRGDVYKKIIASLGDGMKTLEELRQAIQYPKGGALGLYMKNLIVSGYVTQNYSWSIKTTKIGRNHLYRLSDNYLRFYLKYIEPNLPKINKNFFRDLSLMSLPSWDIMFGFQVETLLLKNRLTLLQSLDIPSSDVEADGPYIQRKTVTTKGCQVDYLIQTKTKTLFVCEFKFKRKPLGTSVIEDMEAKLERLSVPRGFGVVPVLFHLGDISDSVHTKKYFYRIIDIADFL